jgi:GT2 family glycosyltransferase
MAPLVLIAQPIRKGTPDALLARNDAVVAALTYPDFERIAWVNEQAAVPGKKFGPNATARNQFVERYLDDAHDYVLWFDADIIEAPAGLVEGLLDLSERRGGAIAAPMTWVERIREGQACLTNGGWFYDTGGFRDALGRSPDVERGVLGTEPEPEMQSVGCVYLVPAWLYREGCKYEPIWDEVEHISFCRQATAKGVRVAATRHLNVTHAYLPKWGEEWHW